MEIIKLKLQRFIAHHYFVRYILFTSDSAQKMLLRTNTLIVAPNSSSRLVYYSCIHFDGGNTTLDLAAYLVSLGRVNNSIKKYFQGYCSSATLAVGSWSTWSQVDKKYNAQLPLLAIPSIRQSTGNYILEKIWSTLAQRK